MNELLKALDRYYEITSDLYGNGCEHGFKPASACPNEHCEKRHLNVLWDKEMPE